MKKITLFLVAVLAWVGTASAQDAQSLMTFNWAHAVEGAVNSGNNVMEMVKTNDDSYLVASKFGSKTGSQTVKFDGEELVGVMGSPYSEGNSNNGNLLLQKVSNAGSVAWNVYTRKGDVSTVNLAAADDGGIVVALKTRAWVKEAGYDNLLEVVDAAGAVTTIKDMGTTASEYRFLILKLDADGKLSWSRLVCGLVKTYDKGKTVDNAYLNACALDGDGNIYLAGNFRSALYFKKGDGTVATLESESTPDEYFNVQNSLGDLFLVKLDKEGYYLNSLVTAAVSYASVDQMVVHDGKIFLDGRLQGKDATVKLGNTSVAASTDRQNLLVASVNATDLSVNYAKVLYPVVNSKNSFAIQNKGAQYVDGVVYFTGSLNGGLSTEINGSAFVETGATQLKGYVAKMDAETGNFSAQLYKEGTISNFFGVYPLKETLYAYGYDMSKGAILVPFDQSSLSAGTPVVVAQGGTVAAAAAPVVDGDNLIMMNRSNKQMSFYGTDVKSAAVSGFSAFYYSYKINATATGINAAKASAVTDGVNVYTADGIFIKTVSSVTDAKQGLSKGVYIIGTQKVVVE